MPEDSPAGQSEQERHAAEQKAEIRKQINEINERLGYGFMERDIAGMTNYFCRTLYDSLNARLIDPSMRSTIIESNVPIIAEGMGYRANRRGSGNPLRRLPHE